MIGGEWKRAEGQQEQPESTTACGRVRTALIR
jgi:hypothetical protein